MKKQILCSGLLMLSCMCTLQTYGQSLGFDRHVADHNNQPLNAPAMAIAFDGRIYNAYSSGKHIVITVSNDHGKTWLPFQTLSLPGYSFASPSLIVTGNSPADLSLFIAGIKRQDNGAAQSVFVQQYDAATGTLISERLRQSIPGEIYTCDLAAGHTAKGDHSISLLYAANLGNVRTVLQQTSVDGGKNFTIANTVATTKAYLRNVSIDFGMSEHASNGRYFMAWDEYSSPKAAWGKVYTSRNAATVMSATIKPVEVNPGMAGKLRRPAIAVSRSADNDSASCTAVLLTECASGDNGAGVAICSFNNQRAHFTNYWGQTLLSDHGSQPVIAFDQANQSFAASFYNKSDKSIQLIKRSFTAAGKWDQIAINYADATLLQDPQPCIVIDPLYHQAAMSWVSDARNTIYFDAEYNNTPSSLQEIAARNEGNYNTVTWTAGQADDNGDAVLERSMDNITFVPLATVAQKGHPFANNYKDFNPGKGTNYYRVRLASQYSGTVSAYAGLLAEGGLSVYPNPAARYLTISTPAAANQAAVTVYTLTGQQCLSNPVNGNTTTIDMGKLPGGTYLVEYTNGKERKATRITKVQP